MDPHTWTENVCASGESDDFRQGRVLPNRDQTECGGWFEGTVYDHKDGNDTATITAQAGTGGVGEGIPTLRTPTVHAPAVGIAWSEVEYLHGVPVTDYEIHWSPNGATGWTQLETELSLAEYADLAIQSGQTRHYRVRAVNEAGVKGPWSQSAVARTGGASEAPGAPTGVTAAADGGSSIEVSWLAPLDDGGTDITGYDVQWSADGSGGWNNAGSTAEGETLNYTDPGLTFGATRYYRVAARNARGRGDWSAPPHPSATTESGVPGAPSLTARFTASHSIALEWTVPVDNGSSISGYEVQWSPDGSAGSWSDLHTANSTVTAYDDTGLDPGTQRYYQVRAVNSVGNGSWSRPANAVTPAALPDPPTLRAEANGESGISLSWDPPANDGGAAINAYELQVSTNDGATYSLVTITSGSARSYTQGGMQPGTTRHYQLRARNSAGWGEFSGAVSATTLTGVPAAPVLTARANGSTEIKLAWTKPDDRGSEIFFYELQQSDDGANWSTISSRLPAADTEYVHDGLGAGNVKHYRIRAQNSNGYGQWSAAVSATTDAGGPDAPGLTATAVSDNQIDLKLDGSRRQRVDHPGLLGGTLPGRQRSVGAADQQPYAPYRTATTTCSGV